MNALHIVRVLLRRSALIAAVTLAIPKPSNPITIEPTQSLETAWRDTAVPLALRPENHPSGCNPK